MGIPSFPRSRWLWLGTFGTISGAALVQSHGAESRAPRRTESKHGLYGALNQEPLEKYDNL